MFKIIAINCWVPLELLESTRCWTAAETRDGQTTDGFIPSNVPSDLLLCESLFKSPHAVPEFGSGGHQRSR